MIQSLLIAALLSQESFAYVDTKHPVLVAVSDAPIAVVGDPLAPNNPAVEVHAGDVVPWDGVCMDKPTAVVIGKRIAYCEGSLQKAEESFLISKPILIGGLIGTVLVGAAIGAAVAVAVKK